MTDRATDRVIEGHPIYHDWHFRTDEVTEVNSRKVPVTIRRWYRCDFCPTECYDEINVYQWERRHRRYRYDRGVTIERVSKEEFLRTNFLATTDLSAAVKTLLQKFKGGR